MDSVEVPVYKQSDRTTINDALSELRRWERGAIVIHDQTGYRLLFAGELLRARRDGVEIVQDIAGGEPMLAATEKEARSHDLNLHWPEDSQHQFEAILDEYNYHYVLVQPPPIPQSLARLFYLPKW